MKNRFFIFTLPLLLGYTPLQAAKSDSLLAGQYEDVKLIVNNRILAKINEKSITTYDVMKKMDIGFYQYFPEYSSSVEARYRFYETNWKDTLEELINKELILADAKESKVELSSGDVRQEMEFLFGPNMIANLDKVGMSFEEASKIVQGDLLFRRMLGARVHAKVVRLVTPSKVRRAYEEFIQDPNNKRLTNWRYQVVTVRDRTDKKAEETANKAYQLLSEGVPLSQLVATMTEKNMLGRKAKLTISEEIQNNEKELSASYKQVLSKMDTNTYSQPSSHKSRSDNMLVYRIFYVKEKISGGMPSFKEMENTLKDKLLDEVLEKETALYVQRLRQHFHIKDSDLKAMIPSDYQPFMLK